MPWAALLGGLLEIAGSLVGRVLLALGVGYASYSGLNVALDALKTMFTSNMNTVGAFVLSCAGLLQIDVIFGMFVTVVTSKLIIAGVNSGTVKRLVLK